MAGLAGALGRKGAHAGRGRPWRSLALGLVVALVCSSLVAVAATQRKAAAVEPPPGGLVSSEPNVDWPQGQFSVSDDGAAQYSLPLWMPKGRGELHPKLTLAYNSRGGNGPVGVGWSLQGLSSITPCARTVAQDGVRDAVRFAASDVYCLDGNRLRPVGAQSGPEREYRTEHDIFAKVIAFGMDDNLPDYFKVWTKDRQILTFGQSAAARLAAFQLKAGDDVDNPSLVQASTSPVVAAWALEQMEDRNNNVATIQYQTTEAGQGGLWSVEMVPKSISYAPNRTVQFVYQTRPDPVDGFMSGVHTRTGQRLLRVELRGGPQGGTAELLRQYQLSYRNDSTTGRSLLSSIKECDQDNICLRPLEFQWSSGSNDFDPVDTTVTDAGAPQVDGRSRLYAHDVDGDGRDDLIYPVQAATWKLRRNTGAANVFGDAQLAGIPPADDNPTFPERRIQPELRPIDVDRDGRMDFMAQVRVEPNPGPITYEFRLYASNGTSYAPYSPDLTGGHISVLDKDQPYFLDLDGNGMPDYLTPRSEQPANQRFFYRVNTGSGFSDLVNSQVVGPRGPVGRTRTLDADGDGRAGLLVGNSTATPHRYDLFGVDAQGTASLVPAASAGVNLPYPPPTANPGDLTFADVNGDGLEDAVYPLSGLRVQLNSGHGFSQMIPGPADYVSPPPPPPPPVGLPGSPVRVVDFDNDGRQDIMVLRGTGAIEVYKWRDGAFVRVPLSVGASGYENTQTLDFDGNGVVDLVRIASGHVQVLKRKAGPPDQLVSASVTEGSGPRVEFDYTTLANSAVHTPGTCTYPQYCPKQGGSVVSEHRVANGLGGGGMNRFTHFYEAARTDLAGRGWLGFASHKVTDQQTGTITVTDFDNVTRDAAIKTYPRALLPQETRVTVADGASNTIFMHITTNTNELRALGSGTYTVELRKTVDVEQEAVLPSTAWHELHTRTTQHVYDELGNETDTTSQVTGGRSLHDVMTYDNDQTNWLIGKLRTKNSTGCTNAGVCTTRHTTYDYYDNGNPKETVVEPNNATLKLTTTTVYGDFGTIASVTRTDSAGASRQESFEYNNDKLHATATIDALGHKTLVDTHSGLGVPLSTTDPNGVTTTMRYDKFGRLRETNRSDGSFEHISHLNFLGLQITGTDVSGGGQTLVSMDQLGRETTRQVKGFDGRMATSHTYYDAQGRVAKTTRPAFSDETVQSTTFEYDKRDRLLRQTAPDGALIRHSYTGLETHTFDAKGTESYTVQNKDGDVESSFEHDPSSTGWLQTKFEYGPFGETTKVTAPDNTAQVMTYDVLGHRTRHEDPSAGVTISTYDAFGEVTTQTDGAGVTTRYAYDLLGRVTTTSSPDGTARNTWDTAPNGIGKLTKATSADGVATSYAYNPLSQLQTAAWTVDGTNYQFDYGYDSVGRRASVTYPAIPGASGAGRLQVTNVYNPNGYLNQVKDAAAGGTVYWQVDTRGADGQLTQETLGNGVTGTRGYDPKTGLLQTIKATGPDGAKLSSVASFYDLNRNLTTRSSGDDYHYDSLNRLTQWSGLGRNDTGTVTWLNNFAYDTVGNLKTETFQFTGGAKQTTTYAYGQNGAPPHALTSRNSDTYGYDKAGWQTSGPQRTVTYNRAGLPKVLTWGQGQRSEFAYDASGARVRKRDAAHSLVTVAGLFERWISNPGGDPLPDGTGARNTYNIVGDGRIVAQVTKVQADAGGPVTDTQVAYLHPDGQGSTVLTTTSAGTVKERFVYDPWGRRFGGDGQPENVGSRGEPRQGYTGYEHDDEFGLINAKGRIYDPEERRFLTPDPAPPADPLSSQGYNRYSYVQDNPATLTDPTGLQPPLALQAGMCGESMDVVCPQLPTTPEDWASYGDQVWLAVAAAGKDTGPGQWGAPPTSDDTHSAEPMQLEGGEVIVVTGKPQEHHQGNYFSTEGMGSDTKYFAMRPEDKAPRQTSADDYFGLLAQSKANENYTAEQWSSAYGGVDALGGALETTVKVAVVVQGVFGAASGVKSLVSLARAGVAVTEEAAETAAAVETTAAGGAAAEDAAVLGGDAVEGAPVMAGEPPSAPVEPPSSPTTYFHQLNKGGMQDIIANQRLISTEAAPIAGGGEGVRAVMGRFEGALDIGDKPIIEFTTEVIPRINRGQGWAIWDLPAGEYLPIQVTAVHLPPW